MPSFMIHLLTARLADQSRGPLYFIGNLAPDAQNSFQLKEHAHLRDCPDRGAALAEFARGIDPAEDFAEGVLLHLYTDWRWDTTQLRRYRDTVEDLASYAWVKDYRRETWLASSWLYRTHSWAPGMWKDMLAIPRKNYGALDGIAPGEIFSLLDNGRQRLEDNRGPPSQFYTTEIVETFAKETAVSYMTWRQS